MPDKKKNSEDQEKSLDRIEDAEILKTEENESLSTQATDAVEPEKPSDQPDQTVSIDTEDTARLDPSKPQDDDVTPQQDFEDLSKEPEPVSTTPSEAPAAAPVKTEIIRKGGFVPMLLGGVAAAAIGFGLAQSGALNGIPLSNRPNLESALGDLTARVDAQQASLSEIGTRLSTLEDTPAPEANDMAQVVDDLSIQIGVLAQRIDAIEARPAPVTGAVDADLQAAIDAAKAELDAIRQAVADQGGQITAMTDAAAREEEAAQLTARAALQRAAVTRIQTALDAGTSFEEALADLRDSGVDVPEALASVAANGVVTLPALQSGFPDLARDALRAARQDAGATGIGGFLETQLGLRSLQPREGDDPDAVLSRAEAALRDGAVADALTQIAALPEPAMAILSDWSAQAQARLAALSAAQDLAQSVNTN